MATTIAASRPLRIWMITPEIHRIKKTGGLADAVYGLTEGLTHRGCRVTAIMPKHMGTLEFFLRHRFKSLVHFTTLQVPMGNQTIESEVYKAFLGEGENRFYLFFIDTVDCAQFGNRSRLYGYKDDPYRFLFLNRATQQLYEHILRCSQANRRLRPFIPDIIHGHDWQSGFTPFFFRHDAGRVPPFFYSIHNLGYGFECGVSLGEFSLLANLDAAREADVFSWDRGIEFYDKADAHKTGIMLARRIVTVSPQYAKEVLRGDTPHPANLYQGILQTRRADIRGILNGLPDSFSPQYFFNAGFIPAAFSVDDLSGRKVNRQALQAKLLLPQDEEAMIVVWSSRIAHQKGIDLVIDSLPEIIRRVPKAQFVFIGDGDEVSIEALKQLCIDYPQKVRYSAFDEQLEMLALAGGDTLLMPSRYEPCGLNQMKAHKLGCIPITHETGGLIDTVTDGQTGFTFWGLTQENLVGKMEGVWQAYQHKGYWEGVIRTIMALDYSWTTRAGEYEQLYREALEQ